MFAAKLDADTLDCFRTCDFSWLGIWLGRTQDVFYNMETTNPEIDKRGKSSETGGHEAWSKKKKEVGVFYPGDRVKEHLQTGPGGSYILQRQTWLSLTHKKTLCCRRTSLKAWLLLHLSSVVTPHSPLTGSLCKLWCLTISYLDAEQFAERKDQTGSFFISLAFSSSCVKMITVPLSAHVCGYSSMSRYLQSDEHLAAPLHGAEAE